MTLRCLFVDFDSYFASVEQYDEPALRGRPVAVVPVAAETTCCLAASYEAKALGIRTGTAVSDARALCPGIAFRLARPARYIEVHHQVMAAVEDCIPHGTPDSIDEVACWLIGRERERGNAEAIARRIRQTLAGRGFSPAITCSIGIAPNRFLAKTASDMRKPDGLTVLEASDLPHALHGLALRDLCGIGPSMERRLQAAGIDSVARLCAAPREHLRAAWGSVEGERFWMQLRGHELPARSSDRGSIGHSHVLGPELRSFDGARSVLFKLLAKAAMRLRKDSLLARGLAIRIRFVGQEARFERDLAFAPLDDTPALLHLLGEQLAQLQDQARHGHWNPRRHPPLSVAVTLVGLEPAGATSGELVPGRRRDRDMSAVVDRINRRFGNNAVYFGAMQQAIAQAAAPMRIPFSHVPETALEQDLQAHGRPVLPGADAGDLYRQRERQFKVLAEGTHRQAQQKRAPSDAPRPAFKAGAGGRTPAPARAVEPDPGVGQTRPLF